MMTSGLRFSPYILAYILDGPLGWPTRGHMKRSATAYLAPGSDVSFSHHRDHVTQAGKPFKPGMHAPPWPFLVPGSWFVCACLYSLHILEKYLIVI